MRLRAIDHVTLQVRDIERAREYYQNVFGFSCAVPDRGNRRQLQLESADVHFFLEENREIGADYVGVQHISFEVDDLHAVCELLRQRGERFECGEYRGFTRRNHRWCEWRDPEGIRVECVEHTR